MMDGAKLLYWRGFHSIHVIRVGLNVTYLFHYFNENKAIKRSKTRR